MIFDQFFIYVFATFPKPTLIKNHYIKTMQYSKTKQALDDTKAELEDANQTVEY